MSLRPVYKAITVSASDSAGCNGVQGDLGIFSAFGVHGSSVVTVVTAQNTLEVAAIAEVPDEVVIAQIDTVLHDIGADAAKTGMLSSASIIQNVADRLEAWGIPHLVVDPVMMSKGGVALLQPDAVQALKVDLLPHATVITPTVAEAEVIVNRRIASPAHAQEAAKAIATLGPSTVVIKAPAEAMSSVGVVFHQGAFIAMDRPIVDFASILGAGTAFSAAVTALLARGLDIPTAINTALTYVHFLADGALSIGEGDPIVDYLLPLPPAVASTLT